MTLLGNLAKKEASWSALFIQNYLTFCKQHLYNALLEIHKHLGPHVTKQTEPSIGFAGSSISVAI